MIHHDHDWPHRRVRIRRLFSHLEEAAHKHGIEIASVQSLTEYFTGFFTQSLERIMADAKDLNAKIAELKQAVADDEAADDANEARLEAVIADLEAKLAAVPAADFQSQIDELNAIKASLHGPAGETNVPATPS
jgi:hypothetical protein